MSPKKHPLSSVIPIRLILIVAFLMISTGCESLRYYGQTIYGQVDILARRRPINQLLIEPDTPEALKMKLRHVLDIREFAENELHLPVADNYLSFVALERPYVVLNVFAAPEFSFSPQTWCFPIVGCTAYRGYFSEKSAHAYAQKLKAQGLDVFIGQVTAYSTLGWFDDPVLSTVIDRSKTGLAALIFHELAHQILYVADDTTFNESFATAVEQEGLRRWTLATGDDTAWEDYLAFRRRHLEFNILVMKYRDQLERLYQEEMPAEEKRYRKKLIIKELKQAYRHLKQQWQGYAGYDHWFQGPINNAKINAVATYHALVLAFTNVIEHSQGDLARFYQTCRNLSRKPKTERRQALQNIK